MQRRARVYRVRRASHSPEFHLEYDHNQPEGGPCMKHFKIIVEKHPDGYVAYPLGLKGVVIGEGDSYEDAFADVKSAIRFHIETFGWDAVK